MQDSAPCMTVGLIRKYKKPIIKKNIILLTEKKYNIAYIKICMQKKNKVYFNIMSVFWR